MDFEAILTEAHNAAEVAVKAEIAVRPENERDFDCGVAWVTIDGNSPLARHCIRARRKAFSGTDIELWNKRANYGSKGFPKVRGWQFLNPGKFNGQSISIHEVGAKAFRAALAKHDIHADFGSRLEYGVNSFYFFKGTAP